MKKPTDFATKKDFIKYLVANKAEIINLKKTAIKYSEVQLSLHDEENIPVLKQLATRHKDDIASGVIKRTIIGNTYNWMDSHDDVHVNGLFGKSISERGTDKIWHLHDHEHKITAKVGKPVLFKEESLAWKDLGVDIPGMTMSLMMDSNIRKDLNPLVFGMYLSKEITQHSVGMRYIKVDLAVNDPEQKVEYAEWNKHIGNIGNRAKAEDQGYFFAVKEAQLIEISAVLAGSNELTPTMENESKADPTINELLTSNAIKTAVSKLTVEEARIVYEQIGKDLAKIDAEKSFSRIDYDYLVKNFKN